MVKLERDQEGSKMESLTPLNVNEGVASFKASLHSTVPSSSKVGLGSGGQGQSGPFKVRSFPFSSIGEGETGYEYERVLSQERAARKHAEFLADSHAKSARVLEVSKTELVRKMLSMKIEMERSEREKSEAERLRKHANEPSSLEVISDMKKQIEVTQGELSDSNHHLAEQSRKSAIAAQELMSMNKNLRSMEEELRRTKSKLTEAERSKHEVMMRTTNFEKRLKSREALSENRLQAAEVQSAQAQSMLHRLEEKIAYLDRRSFPGTPASTGGVGVAPLQSHRKDENNALEATTSSPSTERRAAGVIDPADPDRKAALRKLVLKNVDIVNDLTSNPRGVEASASFAVPNVIENDGDLHISEARTVLIDPRKLDPTVGAHMDYLTFKAFSSDKFKRNTTDLDKASYIHQRQFAARKDSMQSPAIDQTVKDTHAAYAEFSKYKRLQSHDNVSAAEKKLSALVNENHQLKVSKEKFEIQCKSAVEELEEVREKLRVIRLENEQYKSMSSNQEQDLITWKVKTFEEIALLDSNIRKVVEEAQSSIEERANESVLSKLGDTEKKMRKLESCLKGLTKTFTKDKKELEKTSSELARTKELYEEQKQVVIDMEEEHEKKKSEVAESLEAAKKMQEEAEEEKQTTRSTYKKKLAALQGSSSQSLDIFQQKLNEISIKAARVFVEADKKTNAFDELLTGRILEDGVKEIAEELEKELSRCDDLNQEVIASAKASMEELSINLSRAEQLKEKLVEDLDAERQDKVSLVEKAETSEKKAEAAMQEVTTIQESFEKLKAESDEKDEKLQNTIAEAAHLLEEVDELTERIVEKEKEFVGLQEEVKEISESKSEVEVELKTCKSSLEEAKKESTSAKETVETLQLSVQEKEEELVASKEKFESQMSELSVSLDESKEQIEEIKTEKESLTSELDDMSKRLTEAETSCEEASAVIVKMKQIHEKEKKELVDNLEDENKELQDQFFHATKKVEELEQQVEIEHHELESFGSTIAAAEKQAEEAQLKTVEAEDKVRVMEMEKQEARDEVKELREQLENAVSQKQAAEERTASAISKLYDMESRVEYEKKRAEGVVKVLSQQLNMEGRPQTAALISDFARLQQQLESEVDQSRKAELEERLSSLKLAMQYDEANSGAGNASFMQLENKLQTERDIRKKLEADLKEALDKCLANEEENQMLLKEYEEVVEENKFLVSQIENLSK